MTVRLTTLDNGLRVVTDAMDTVQTVSVGAWVDAGARHEPPSINGISHMLEHMAFKGTKRRSALDIAVEIENVGGHVNAYTSREHTAYYAKMLKEDMPLALDIIADILQHSEMDQEELERERTVILQEIHQANDTPDDIVFDYFQETAFPDQAVGRPVLGTLDLVSGFNRDTLMNYMQSQYAPPSMIVAAAGCVNHDQFVEMASEAFDDLPDPCSREVEAATYRGGDFRESRDLEQVHVLMGLEGIPYSDEDFHAASVYCTLLGGGMSSRLFQEIREKRGMVYSVYSFMSSLHDSGMFGIYAGTGEKEAAEVVPVICDELTRSTKDVTDDEMNRARAQLKAGILMSLESSSSRCEQAARQLLVYGRTIPLEETVAKIEAVDKEAVMRVASRVIASPLTMTALGPVGQIEPFSTTKGRLS
ncbi:MAG: insulinase family protein [Rhodospirillales bacterium]|jgi:predicted Zn-dependent peptidase|nr:insulinase family protein [Rhodospirillales bacterium]MBT4041416.1 insulinase family protein [Rhodospirillales bacterium]MBT4628287.1 insulinase family protein [Rhodospirillales bacterium]MBT5352301.1 insulinase family protein [Rhodospirillales bacterium]MBT5521050.1 insulinase family protein [Rhodospirillales bacterium]